LHDYVLFGVNIGLRPDEAWGLQFRDVTIVDDEDPGKLFEPLATRLKDRGWFVPLPEPPVT
jgi:hypothetical protein